MPARSAASYRGPVGRFRQLLRAWQLDAALAVLAVAAVTVALGVYVARSYLGGPVFATAPFALYSLASSWGWRRAVPVAAVSAGALSALGPLSSDHHAGWS